MKIIELVLYNQEKNELKLYSCASWKSEIWEGEPYIVWSTLEIAISYGWEVIGEL